MGPKKKIFLGKALIRDRFSNNKRSGKSSNLHTTDFDDGVDFSKINIKSVTEENSLDDFLSTAAMASTQFYAERMNATIVTVDNLVPSKEELERNVRVQEEHKSLLRIPRRSKWDESTTAEELEESERQTFLEWRRSLAVLAETEGIIITPYEKNIEFWRQLWRVIERSDVVVQIVDARNPLLFRCEDLEKYVKEIGSEKLNVILINKADFLTESQRKHWLDYFKDQDLTVYFWSALNELEESEENDDEATDSSLLTKKQLLDCLRTLGKRVKEKDEMVTVGFIGYPNVGKSSTMNALLTERIVPEDGTKLKNYRASISATPGKTKHFQTFYIDDRLLLCDCPGLVMPNFVSSKAEMITNGILPIDQMQDHIAPVSVVCSTIPRNLLKHIYGINLPLPDENSVNDAPNPHQLLTAYARVRGFMSHKGVPDGSRAARIILKDYVNGKLCYCNSPPTISEEDYGSRPAVPDDVNDILPPEAIEEKRQAIVTESVDDFLIEKEFEVNKKALKELKAQQQFSKKHFNVNKKDKLRRIHRHLDDHD